MIWHLFQIKNNAFTVTVNHEQPIISGHGDVSIRQRCHILHVAHVAVVTSALYLAQQPQLGVEDGDAAVVALPQLVVGQQTQAVRVTRQLN